MSRRESRREARRDVGGNGGRRCNSVSRSVDWQKQRVRSVHQLLQATGRMAVIEQAGRALRQESEELTNHLQIGVPTDGRMVTGKLTNQQRRVPINNQQAGLEVLVELDVSWKESRHEARQEVTGGSGALVI